jgi:hypothetical protein
VIPDLPPLLSVAALADRLGRDLDATEARRAPAVIEDVSAAIRMETGQFFSHMTSEVALKVRHGLIRLPQRPVLDVNEVSDVDGRRGLAWDWDGGDLIEVWEGDLGFDFEPSTRSSLRAVVSYEHGYDDPPPDVMGVAASVCLRTLGQAPTVSGIQSESIGGYSYSVGVIGASGAFGFLDAEQAVLRRYKRSAGTIVPTVVR